MATLDADASLLDLLEAPAAFCDARGLVLACNEAFAAWAGPRGADARIEINEGRGALLVEGRTPRALVAFPTAGGGWLALAAGTEAWGPLAAVASAIARRLDRVQATIEANAAMGLLEQPEEAVAQCLRETLAAAQELKTLREQVRALAGPTEAPRGAVCLRTMLQEAVTVLPAGTRVELIDTDGDVTVEADRGQLFAHLVRLMGALATRGSPLRIGLRGGDPVRIAMNIPPPSWPLERDADIKAARRVLVAHGGRMLMDAGGTVTVELPAWGRATAAVGPVGGGRTVLIADDDESTLAMMTAVLRRAGFRVISADNGVAASALLRQHGEEIVAIVADAVLPGRSGVELATEARGRRPHIPVLLVSGHPSDLLGTDEHLPLLAKPFGARALAEHVRRLVERGGPA